MWIRWQVLLLVFLCSCREPREPAKPEPEAARPEQDQQSVSWLHRYDLGEDHPVTMKLSRGLSEISGLAMTPDGRLLGHDDEMPVVYEIDHRSGAIVRRFTVGSGSMHEDLEGIAVKGDTVFLVNSSGDLFEFQEAADRERTGFRLHKTFLSRRYDVEGLEYDPVDDCLLLVCKGYPGKHHDGFKAVYRFPLSTRTLEEFPRFLIPLDEVKKKARKGNFNPSGIALHPSAGTFFVISADGELAIEIDRGGHILDQQEISHKANPHPEGITFLEDRTMLIANDGQGGMGTITVYPPQDRDRQ